MHDLFSDWYLVADPAATGDTIRRRWAATEELLAALSKPVAVELALFVTRTSASAPSTLGAVYKKHDETMPTRGIDEELRVLSGALLRLAMERNEGEQRSLASVAALALLAGVFGMKTQPTWIEEHLHAAVQTLSRLADETRAPSTALPLVDPPTAAAIEAALRASESRIDALSESNDYLWWAFTRHSRALDSAYSLLAPELVAIAAPIDLFAFGRNIPLPAECETLLLHLLLELQAASTNVLSFKICLTGLGRERAQQLSRPVPTACAHLCPVLSGIQTVSVGQGWPADFEKIFGFRITAKFGMPSVAVQLLRELSLVKVFAA